MVAVVIEREGFKAPIIPQTRTYIQTLVTTMGLNQAQGEWKADLSHSRVHLPCQHPRPSEQTSACVCYASAQAALVQLTISLFPSFWD